MLLVIDVGNTNTVIGIYDGEKLVESWRIGTAVERTTDEYGIMLKELLVFSKVKRPDIDGMILSCVVPPLRQSLIDLGKKYLDVEPLVVEPGVRTGLALHFDNPREVGADRIVNAVGGFSKYHTGLIIIDMGTATTFDFVSSQGVYEGGVIAPGLGISAEALFQKASKLPRVELIQPKTVIGRNTISAMQSGIINGYAGLIDAIVMKMKKEIKEFYPSEPAPKVIATGGLVKTIAEESKTIEEVDMDLTLEGLRIVYQINQEDKAKKEPPKQS